jgi:hypothetical protein
VFAADVDGDGDIDALSASSYYDKIAWYEHDGNQNFAEHTITTAADGASSVFVADVDGDGDLDVLSASYADSKIAWYENRFGFDVTGDPQTRPLSPTIPPLPIPAPGLVAVVQVPVSRPELPRRANAATLAEPTERASSRQAYVFAASYRTTLVQTAEITSWTDAVSDDLQLDAVFDL